MELGKADRLLFECVMLQFPFWLAVPTGALSSGNSIEYDCAQTYSFSSAEKMAVFLTIHKNVQWETRLVDRYSTPAVFAKLTDNGFTMLRHNPHENGSDGTDVLLADILATLQPKPMQNGD